MKFSAAILLQIMLVFLTLPVTHNLFAAKQQSCKADKCADICPLKSKQKQSSNKTCNNGLCNPFVNCPFCQYVTTEQLTLSVIILPLNKVSAGRNENAVFSYNKECWHPPEVI
jgi:hypothetical protein